MLIACRVSPECEPQQEGPVHRLGREGRRGVGKRGEREMEWGEMERRGGVEVEKRKRKGERGEE